MNLSFSFRPAVWWTWALLAFGLLALMVWFPPLDTGIAHDTYSAAAEGKRAFYRLVAEHVDAVRSTERLTQASTRLLEDETLCILGPARWPSGAEWTEILKWVETGGQLIFACSGSEDRTIPQLGVHYIPHDEERPDDSLPPETELIHSREIAWWTDGHLETERGDILAEYAGETQAVATRHGAGRAVIVATPLVFSNQLLTFGDNPVLAYRLLEAAGPVNYVTFDESLNATGAAKATAVLLDPALRPLTLQLALLLVLYAWWNSLRYGPTAGAAVTPRHNLVDHTDALGAQYWRLGDGAAVLRSYLRALRTEFGLQPQKGTLPVVFTVAARRLERTIASVQSDVESARRAARQKTLDRRVAARLIQRMATIHRSIITR